MDRTDYLAQIEEQTIAALTNDEQMTAEDRARAIATIRRVVAEARTAPPAD